MNIYIDKLEYIFTLNKVCPSHSIDHAIAVMNNSKKAIECCDFKLNEDTIKCILLASLLHDADDRKFFPKNFKYENVKEILFDMDNDSVDLITKMISLVSSAINGDNIPYNIEEWMLYPRYSDRLEAIGFIGIKRCYQYAITFNNKLYTDKTLFASNEEDLWKIATIQRYRDYKGVSESMIDHYYDKLLRAGDFPIRNNFFDEESKKRKQISINFILNCGINKDCLTHFINNKMSSSEQEATLETFNQLLDARPSIYSDPLYYNSCMSKEKDVIDTLVNKITTIYI